MTALPDKLLLRRGEVKIALGIDENVMKQIVAEKLLVPVRFGRSRAFYRRNDVEKLWKEFGGK